MKSIAHTLDGWFKYWALLPLIALLILLVISPIVRLIGMSFSEVRFAAGHLAWKPVGFSNYRAILSDPNAVIALKNTVVLAVLSVIIETGLGLALAIAVSRAVRGSFVYRTILLLPILLPPIAVGVMWLLIYQNNYGLLNVVLQKIGVQGPPWLASKTLAFPAIVVVDIWHWTSFIFMILLAGIESIPTELTEAARIDGASERRIVATIILPLLRPTLMIAIVLRTIFAFKIFEEIYLLTNGGPGTATEVISSYVMKVFFEQSRYGYAAALSVGTAIFIVVFILLFQWIQRMIGRGSR